MSDYGFAFEKQGLGKNEGPVDPSEEYFTGSIAESLARETIQNSLDAVAGEGPVRVTFELQTTRTEDLPDIATLQSVIDAALPEYRNHQGAHLIEDAAAALGSTFTDVLRVGDYGTTGLTGSERLADSASALSALTRGSGVSSSDGSRGGSFGIGSKAGLAASTLRTVFFNSKTHPDQPDVFAGYSCHASFIDSHGVRRVASGYYRDRKVLDDFAYLQSWQPFAPFEPRTEAGTDVYVVGYRGAEDDPHLQDIRRAVARYFLAAIFHGRLIVTGVTPSGSWTLNQGNLEEYLKSEEQLRRTVLPFHVALQDPNPYQMEHPDLGTLQLYVNEDDTLDKSLWTWAMRQRLMHVTTYRHTSISVPYAAVFVASSEEGNALLRSLEPPQHTAWEEGRARHGRKTVQAVKTFIHDGLHARIKVHSGKKATIQGLARFLPADDLVSTPVGEGTAPTPGLPEDIESGSMVGRDAPERNVDVKPSGPVRVTVARPGVGAEDGAPGTGGRDTGGSTKRKQQGGSKPRNTNEDDDGTSRIPKRVVRARSWQTPLGTYRLVLRVTEATRGDLVIAALDEDGTPIRGFQLPISTATELATNAVFQTAPGMVRAVELNPERPLTLEISVEGNDRYRLGVGE